MEKTGHLFLGIALGIILIVSTYYFLGWFNFKDLNSFALICIIIYVYSLISDIDMKNSAITWSFIPIGLMLAGAGYFSHNNVYTLWGLGLITITFLSATMLSHRGITHSILFGIAISLPWVYFSYQYAALAFVCFYSHNIGDEEYFKLI